MLAHDFSEQSSGLAIVWGGCVAGVLVEMNLQAPKTCHCIFGHNVVWRRTNQCEHGKPRANRRALLPAAEARAIPSALDIAAFFFFFFLEGGFY